MSDRPLARDPYGRFVIWPVPEMVEFGTMVRAARGRAALSQHELARLSDVSQSTICRLERGLVPGMATWKLVRIGLALGAAFPLGFCPHDHPCPWPARPRVAKKNGYATDRLTDGIVARQP